MTASTTRAEQVRNQVRVRPLVDDPELGQRVRDEDRQGTGYLDRFAHTPVMPKRIGLVLTLVLVLAGCGGDSKPEARGPFDYDRRLARVPGQRAREPQLSDRDPRRLLRQPGRRRPSDRLLGQASGKGPRVILAHGAGGDRRQLVVQATWLAGRGAVALVVDSPFARNPGLQFPRACPGFGSSVT